MSLRTFFTKLLGRIGTFDPALMIQEAGEWVGVDCDDTIFAWDMQHFGELKRYRMSDGRELTAVDVLQRIRMRKKVILYTCRLNEDQPEAQRIAAIDQLLVLLKKYRVPYDAIWTKRGKPVCCTIWDNAAWRADNAGTEAMLNGLK